MQSSKLLERENKLKTALQQEETRERVNDSKFRAVAQKMDYEGFRQMVLGANLKPSKAGEIWNMAEKTNTGFQNPQRSLEVNFTPSKTSNWISEWRACKSDSEKFKSLKGVGDYLDKSSDFEVFSECLRVLYEGKISCKFETNDEDILEILEILSNYKGFAQGLKLLSRGEKAKVRELLNALECEEYLVKFGLI